MVRAAAIRALALPPATPEPLTTNPLYDHSSRANYKSVKVGPEHARVCLHQYARTSLIVHDKQ